MKSLKLLIGVCVLSAGMAGTSALADGHLEGVIKARKAVMQLYAHNLGILGAMAKGEADYDAARAAAAANNLKAVANLDQNSVWPEGTDNASMPGKTRALPEIWSTYPAVVDKSNALKDAANALAEVAGNDLASLRGAIGGAGKGCGGCHETFRAEQ